MGSASHDDVAQRDAQPQLPAPELRNLQAIAEMMVDVPIFRRNKLVEAVRPRVRRAPTRRPGPPSDAQPRALAYRRNDGV